MKRRSLTLLVCLLACLALGSVGFAAWVITNDANASDSGTIRVDVVKDARLSISAEIVEGEPIIFGSKTPADGLAHDWMKYEKTVDGSLALDENLTSVIKIVIGNFDYVDTLTITLEEDGSDHYNEALAKNYVAALPQIIMTAEQLQAYVDKDPSDNNTLDGTTLTVYLDINFAWGSAFGGKNPIDYYNAQAYTDPLGDESIQRLQELKEMFEGTEGFEHTVTYVATVEVTTK